MKTTILPNGLTIIQQKTDLKTTAVNILVKVGSNFESEKTYGISHFMEHMLFEGTKKRSALKIASDIEGIGGDIGAYTTNERTCYYVKSLTKHLENSLEVLSDLITNPLFNQESIEKERNIILSEVNMRLDEPRMRQWDLFMETAFKGSPLGRPIIGFNKTIKTISREDLIDFHSQYYSPNNMIMTVVSSRTDILKLIKRYFGSMGSRQTKIPKIKIPKKAPRYAYEKRKINQTYSILGYKVPGLASKDSIVLELIRSILAKGMSGRLFEEIRNKRGLAYDVGAHNNPGVQFGFFAFYIAAEKKNLKESKRIMLHEVSNLHNISAKELRESKNYLEGEHIVEEEDNEKVAENLGLYKYAGNIENHTKFVQQLKKITVADIKRVSKKYLVNPTEVYVG